MYKTSPIYRRVDRRVSMWFSEEQVNIRPDIYYKANLRKVQGKEHNHTPSLY
jgi:hypothetical protein